MAASRPPAKTPRDEPGKFQPRQRETADERRLRQTTAAIEKQADLKREAAERREAKSEADAKK